MHCPPLLSYSAEYFVLKKIAKKSEVFWEFQTLLETIRDILVCAKTWFRNHWLKPWVLSLWHLEGAEACKEKLKKFFAPFCDTSSPWCFYSASSLLLSFTFEELPMPWGPLNRCFLSEKIRAKNLGETEKHPQIAWKLFFFFAFSLSISKYHSTIKLSNSSRNTLLLKLKGCCKFWEIPHSLRILTWEKPKPNPANVSWITGQECILSYCLKSCWNGSERQVKRPTDTAWIVLEEVSKWWEVVAHCQFGNPESCSVSYLYVLLIFASYYNCSSQQEHYLIVQGLVEMRAVISWLLTGIVGCYYDVVGREKCSMSQRAWDFSAQRRIIVPMNY